MQKVQKYENKVNGDCIFNYNDVKGVTPLNGETFQIR